MLPDCNGPAAIFYSRDTIYCGAEMVFFFVAPEMM